MSFVQGVFLTICDCKGNIQFSCFFLIYLTFQVVPKKRFNDLVRKNGVGLTFACMAMRSAVDGPADETNLTGTGEIRLMPDLSTWREIPWYCIFQ